MDRLGEMRFLQLVNWFLGEEAESQGTEQVSPTLAFTLKATPEPTVIITGIITRKCKRATHWAHLLFRWHRPKELDV